MLCLGTFLLCTIRTYSWVSGDRKTVLSGVVQASEGIYFRHLKEVHALEAGTKLNLAKTLMITFLLTVFLETVIMTDDVVSGYTVNTYGQAAAGTFYVLLVLILVVGLYGVSLVWRERKVGYAILLVISFLFALDALSELTGFGGEISVTQIAASTGPFFVWAIITASVVSISSFILSIYGLARKHH